MIERHSSRQIDEMRPAGVFVAETLAALVAHAAVGVSLLDLDALAHERLETPRRAVDRVALGHGARLDGSATRKLPR